MRLLFLLGMLLTSCAHPTEYKHISKYLLANEVIYLSSDLLNVAVFSKEKTRFGPTDLTIANPEWPSFSATYFETADSVQCISIGKSEISDQYAVKRPLTEGENYSCLRTTFRVTHCFYNCRAAIIEMNRPLSGNQPGTYQAYMYVDNCRGVIILSETSDLSNGIPLSAEWLRSEVGILAHPDYPKCRPF